MGASRFVAIVLTFRLEPCANRTLLSSGSGSTATGFLRITESLKSNRLNMNSTDEKALALLGDKKWRMSNLYYIKDKSGQKVLFKPNWAQQELMKPHYLNIVLKARQLGVTTFHSLLFLDTCLFNHNVSAAIIADTKDNAKEIFIDKVQFAYDNLPPELQEIIPTDRANVNELRFENGSVFRVGTSLRSGTVQLLHITEFAKICVENPKKANEIISGALNTIEAGQFCCIESTARGRGGSFYDMCKKAMDIQKEGKILSAMDWKFWFFPWWREPSYSLQHADIFISKEMTSYFEKVESELGITIDQGQRNWYVKKADTQGEYMTREYPSTAEEAFLTSNEGLYWGMQMAKVREERRICHLPYDEHALTYSSFDIGIGDSTAIWVWQLVGKEIHFLTYYENSGEALPHYVNWLKKLPYTFEKHFMPHDADAREKGSGKTYAGIARSLGLKIDIVPRDDNEMFGIEEVRNTLARCWFDQTKCEKGIKSIDSFKKEWNEKLGCYRDRSFHDWASHGAKAFIYGIEGINRMQIGRGLTAEEWRRLRAANTT